MPALIETRRLGARLGGATILDAVDLRLEAAELLGLLGPNGAGKTTLLNLISGLLEPSEGDILLEGRSIAGRSPSERARLGIARGFQSPRLYAGLTARQHLESVIGPSGRGKRVAERLGLAAILDRRPPDLSLTQRRLLDAAMALSADAKVLLFDEPFAGLDPEAEAALGSMMRDSVCEGRGVLLVEHRAKVVAGLCGRTLTLRAGKLISGGERGS